MEEWVLRKGKIRNWLKHNCKEDIGLHLCSVDQKGWYCGLCMTYAPEEICFVADLAKCIPLQRWRV